MTSSAAQNPTPPFLATLRDPFFFIPHTESTKDVDTWLETKEYDKTRKRSALELRRNDRVNIEHALVLATLFPTALPVRPRKNLEGSNV